MVDDKTDNPPNSLLAFSTDQEGPKKTQAIIPSEIPGTGRELEIIFLGKAGPNNYIDSIPEPIPDLGFSFRTTQTSYGRTEILASPFEGFTVEALAINQRTGLPSWEEPNEHGNTVLVASDRGKLGTISRTLDWSGINMGNEGIRSGVIRVTNQRTKGIKYFALGARFIGNPDHWQVRRGIIEVEFHPNIPIIPQGNQLPRLEQ